MQKLEQLNFDNTFARLPDLYHTRLSPTPLPAPYLVSFNAQAAPLIDLDPAEAARAEFAEYFIGNRLLPGSDPLAMLYAGHQFGHYVPQLGDGRALLLGEIKNAAGEYWDVQLKGAGPTPYSRRGDGRAVLRSSIREYLCSEAMHGLGIPSTRALCIVGSDEEIYRESVETAAVVTRLAPSHVRFGSFEIFSQRGQHEALAKLADYVIAKHFPQWVAASDKYAGFLNEVVTRTASLMAQWQAVGFAHGVMNTDNMSILGLTFDYGPFGFMEAFNPAYICNHSDHGGRYAYDQQPHIGLWNLGRLAQALTPLIPVNEAKAILDNYVPIYAESYVRLMSRKLGLTQTHPEDVALLTRLLELMQASQVDYTHLFRNLGAFKARPDEKQPSAGKESPASGARDQFIDRAAFDAWAEIYRARLQSEPSSDLERQTRMNRINPKYILRNYLAQIAIDKAQQERDFSEVDRLRHLLMRPFDEQPESEHYAAAPPDWAGQIEISCSS